MTILQKKAIQHVIEETWKNPDGRELREQLFPDGKPTPEAFIETMAQYVREQKDQKGNTPPMYI